MHDNTRSSGWPTDEPITPIIERESQVTMQSHAPPIVGSAQGTLVTRTSQGARQATRERRIALARAARGVVDVTDTLVVEGDHPVLLCSAARSSSLIIDELCEGQGSPCKRQ